MVPAWPVPLRVGVVSLVTCPAVSGPVTPPGALSLTVTIVGTCGAVRSISTLQALDGWLTLPCGSVALTVKSCVPSPRAVSGVNVQAPVPSAATVPICVVPSKMATTLFGSAVPVRVGVVSLVGSPLGTGVAALPALSVTLVITGVVETVSTTMVIPADGVLSLPAGSVAVTVRVWLPSSSAGGV